MAETQVVLVNGEWIPFTGEVAAESRQQEPAPVTQRSSKRLLHPAGDTCKECGTTLVHATGFKNTRWEAWKCPKGRKGDSHETRWI